MKKILTVVLALCLITLSSMTAFAAETPVSLETDNLGRGSGLVDLTVLKNADGSVTSKSSNISFYLAEPVNAGETVTVHVTGNSVGDFRFWLIDVNETTNSEIYHMSAEGFTTGDFDVTTTFTATAEATELFFKAPTFDGKIDNLTVSSITIDKDGAAAPAEEVVEATDTTTSVPKTGETSYAFIYIALAAMAVVGFVATKKKVINE